MSQADNYISIAEFSKRANISKQRVYQLLNKGLKDFVMEIDGVKMLDIRALERYEKKESNSRLEQPLEQDIESNQKAREQEPLREKADTESNSRLEQYLNKGLNDALIKTIELLQEELKAKNEHIENLTRLLDQSQHLQAQAINKLPEPKKTEPGADAVEVSEPGQTEKKKKGIFNIFKRKSKREVQENE